jgi:hypothetical protein
LQRRALIAANLALFSLLAADPALSQWSDDPNLNLVVANPAGEQTQPKLVARPGGGYYVSWFDNRSGGYDVYLQLLDEQGFPQWTSNGVLVADRSFSSTQDYGLAVDTAGHALLAFRDDRFTGTRITAARVAPSGTLVWGTNGVQLTSGTAFVAAPKIAGTTDGDIVVAWKNDAEVHLQRLDASGGEVWKELVVIDDATQRDYSASDMHRSDDGSIVISMVFQPNGFQGPKHLHAQKVSDLGTFGWGSTPLPVFDGGSLQFGNFPAFVPDGSGGAAFAWYNVNGELQCYAQHVDSAGSESFPHDGVAVSSAARDRSAPDVAYDQVSGSTYVLWSELLPGPTPRFGIYGQRLDAAGARQWGTDGVAVASLSTAEVGSARLILDGTDALASWIRASSVSNQTVLASRLDSSGAVVWSPAQLGVATSASGKSRLVVEQGLTTTVLAWSDSRSGNDDIYAQNINGDGTLGAPAVGPGDSAGLGIDKSLGPLQLTLEWDASCSVGALDYAIYEGTLAALRAGVYDHDSIACTDPAPLLEENVVPGSGGRYYLIVPTGLSAEGSYGTRSGGAERPVSAVQCVPTQTVGCP